MANDTAPKFGTLLQPDFQVQTFGHRCNGYHLGGWRTKMGSLQSNESNHNAMALLALIEQHAGEDFIREVMIWAASGHGSRGRRDHRLRKVRARLRGSRDLAQRLSPARLEDAGRHDTADIFDLC